MEPINKARQISGRGPRAESPKETAAKSKSMRTMHKYFGKPNEIHLPVIVMW